MKHTLLLVMMLTVGAAQAEPVVDARNAELHQKVFVSRPTRCVGEYFTPVAERIHVSKPCEVVQSLRLVWTAQNYAHFGNRQVQVWEGKIAKEIANERTYTRELVDECRGRIISTSEVRYTDRTIRSFGIENPNLDPTINESFLLSPMTGDQVQVELSRAMERCQAL